MDVVKRLFFIFLLFCAGSGLQLPAQVAELTLREDTTVYLNEVHISSYAPAPFRNQTPASVSVLNRKDMDMQITTSMVQAVNTATGVRMEERSPGSYRLSIRGSLIRSPYGVRNVKVYYNGFALTDGGGNTYLNALSVNDLSGVEIVKGPDGSMYGANSGGVVFLQSQPVEAKLTRVNLYGGSYGLAGESFQLTRTTGKHRWTLRQSYQRADGYRRNTRNHRLFIEVSDRWQYRPGYSLEGYAFYSDLAYRTPGGLTKEQYDEDPRQARPATATMPGSVEQQTGITQKMYFGGLHHQAKLTSWLSHSISGWANHVDFTYPFITNYEIRKETTVGARTFFVMEKENNGNWRSSLTVGAEAQRLVTDAYNYDNHAGVKGDIQAYNDIVNTQAFGFARGRIKWNNKLTLEAAVSLNHNGYHFRDTTHFKNNFDPVWMPHFALNYQLIPTIAVRFTVSRGYSTPTTAEVRPSDNKIYRDLQAEKGWNIEGGARFRSSDGRFSADASVFHYRMNDGIIAQVDSKSNTYFVNASKVKQLGVEASTSWYLLPYSDNRIIKSLRWNSSYTWSHFYYDEYVTKGVDNSGKRVAGVPRTVWVNNINLQLPAQLYFFVQHSYNSKVALNDANGVWADAYHVLSAQLGIYMSGKRRVPVRVYLTGDNLLNQKYSLGNDLNAAGNRYYNAAPAVNFQAGMVWEF